MIKPVKFAQEKSRFFIYIIIAVIIFAIVIIGIYYKMSSGQDKDLGPCFNLSSDETNLCWALENSTISFCNNIPVTTKMYQCYGAVAEKTNNPEICKQITAREMSYACFNQMAMLRKDVGICSQNIVDPHWKSQCYIYVAIKYKDEGLCSGIENQYYQNQCYNSVTSVKG